jgi:outer membrane protein TolC
LPAAKSPTTSFRNRNTGTSTIVRAGAVVALAALATTSLYAETLAEAWQQALAGDMTLLAADERIAAADAALEAARAERRPSIAAASSVTRWDDSPAFDFSAVGMAAELALFGGQSLLMSEARVSVPVYTGGRIGASIDAASASATARRADAATLSLDVKLAVAERYVAVLRAESVLAVAASNTGSLAAHARDVEDMFRSGQVPRNDLLAASVSLANARQQELQAASALDIARAAYNRSIGRALDAPVALEAMLPAAENALGANPLDALVAIANENRRELEGLDAVRRTLAAQSSAVRGATRPQLMINGGYTFLENDVLNREDFWALGIGVQWNLFDSGRTRSSAAALSHQSAAIGREHANLLTIIELQVREAWLNVRETRERIAVTEGAVAQADENLRVVRDRYRNGEGTNTEVLDAEALRSISRSNFDTARYDAALAELRLARAVGLL